MCMPLGKLPGPTPRLHEASTAVGWRHMEFISVVSGRPPSVNRPEGSAAVFLTGERLTDEERTTE
jgi:hypothetical protein